jgi:hypothetical protein
VSKRRPEFEVRGVERRDSHRQPLWMDVDGLWGAFFARIGAWVCGRLPTETSTR